MTEEQSVTRLIRQYEAGDDEALVELLDRYAHAMKRVAESKIDRKLKRWVDADDIANAVAFKVARHIKDPTRAQISNRGHLWNLLARMTWTEVNDHRKKKNARKVDFESRGESALTQVGDSEDGPRGFDGIAAMVDSPDDLSAALELIRKIIDLMPDDDHRRVIRLKLQLRSDSEVARKLGLHHMTVKRMLQRIERKLDAASAK